MNLSETLKLALDAIMAHKLRSFLTLLGMIIGVTAFMIVLSLLQGFSAYVDEKLAGIGSNSFTVRRFSFDDFKDTTYEEAAAIAYTKYYRAISAFILPFEARLMYFDTAYNMGNVTAVKMMQKCAGVKPDGLIGPATRERMQFVTEDCLYQARNTAYHRLVKANYKLNKFLKGWLARSSSIFKI